MSKKLKGKLLQVSQLGHPVLRATTKPVKDVKSEKVQELIDDLIATVMDVDGVGIAAPQVYEPIKLFIVASHPNPRYPNAPKMKPTAIINPKILSHSKEKAKDWEGCLSIPGIRGLIPRYKSIKVEYTTREGEIKKREFKNFVARIFQHEYDHLDGIVFLDRIDTTKEIITEKEYQKIVAKEKKKKEAEEKRKKNKKKLATASPAKKVDKKKTK
jgi:peptide deformylase